jgi:hypothetical protein
MGLSLSDFNPFRAAKKVTKAVAKPIRKFSQKFIPKELRWAAPYLAAATPFMLPAGGFGSGIFSGAAGRGFLSGLANVAGQAAADPEGEDINLLSTLLAGGTGALGAEGVGDRLRGGIERGATGVDQFGDIVVPYTESPGFWQGAENLGREGLATAADYLGGAREGLASLGKNPASLFSTEGAKAAATDIAPILTHGTGDVTKASTDQYRRAIDAADLEEQRQMDETSTADDQKAADLTMRYYREAGHDEETIQAALETNDLGEYYVPPEAAAQGGIIGLKHGGMLNLGGNEMDYRGGGFVPIGKRERADDVPARLSKNEFVMTADAVKAAGGGSVNKGAQRMYNVMNQLEARA